MRQPSKRYAPGESPLAKAGQAILDGLDALEIDALNEALDDALDVAVEHGAQYPEGSFGRVATGLAYASLAAVMPISALDVVPGGKAAKLRKAAKAVDTGGDAAKITSKTRKARRPRDIAHRPADSRSPESFANEFSSLNHQKAAAGEYNAHQLMVGKRVQMM
ncbi:hypothetical protein [Agarivorans gilvus]|uniref:Uncharacterized protein n=1 Tax=Agarivorans gilvus TaxID=680279 RepID=A0ABQ1I6Q3_9ALTE|nr:hypothetical protein [Agarivorans gilvus]GGB21860.1 hypothetical protein GCM10007414_39070 [Agarivorans gilvus]